MQNKEVTAKKNPLHSKHKFSKHHTKKKTKVPKTSQTEVLSSNWKKFLEEQKKSNENTKESKCKLRNDKENGNENSKENGTVNGNRNKKKSNLKRKRKISEDGEKHSNEIWFDVDPKLIPEKKCDKKSDSIEKSTSNVSNQDNDSLITKEEELDENKNEIFSSDVTRYIALDCEMVGVGIEGKESILARVSIVNSHGDCLYDKYVAPKEKVVDYRTEVSGISPTHLKNAVDFSVIQKDVSDLLKDRILVGHAVQNDLKVLMMSHPKKYTRDTSRYKPFHKILKTKRPALKRLAKEILQQEIQVGSHNSVVDARITMQLFKKYKKAWEK